MRLRALVSFSCYDSQKTRICFSRSFGSSEWKAKAGIGPTPAALASSGSVMPLFYIAWNMLKEGLVGKLAVLVPVKIYRDWRELRISSLRS